MPDLAKFTLPSGTTYDLKDAEARRLISQMSGFTKFLGVTTTELTDGDTTNPISINGDNVTATAGDIATYGSKEFIFNGTAWQEFGDLSGLGSLAYKNSATGSFTPAGSVGAPTISVSSAGSTATIHNPTKATVATGLSTAAPGATAPSNVITYYSVSNETLSLYQIGYNTGDSISTTDVTVKTGDASYTASQPSFSGSAGTVEVT